MMKVLRKYNHSPDLSELPKECDLISKPILSATTLEDTDALSEELNDELNTEEVCAGLRTGFLSDSERNNMHQMLQQNITAYCY